MNWVHADIDCHIINMWAIDCAYINVNINVNITSHHITLQTWIIGNAWISYCTNLYTFILISYALILIISHDLGFVSLNCLPIILVYLANFLISITIILGYLLLLILLLALTLSSNSYSILLIPPLSISATLSISLSQKIHSFYLKSSLSFSHFPLFLSRKALKAIQILLINLIQILYC